MRKLIKNTDDLPKVFDINKYNDMDKLSAFEWFFLIQSRFLLHDILENGLSNWIGTNKLTDTEEQEAMTLIVASHLEKPLSLDLFVKYKKDNNEIIDLEISSSDHYNFMYKHLPVNELYEDEFESIQLMIKNSGIKLKYTGEDKPFSPVMDILKSHFKFHVKQYDYPITINPYYPDHVIFGEFKKILAQIREKLGFNEKNKSLSKKDLLNWASYKLLPYMDLKILELAENIKITNAIICSVLYKKGEYGEDTLRKSVEPIRRKILDQMVFDGADDVTELSIIDALSYLAYEDVKNMEKS
ncbi:DUF6387 family protein [Acinetobacter baylyi]|uniref:DUF6387 family protein n=1 Tax=Acinetobacter baylyi TaxID=202950 RepID=UPI001D0D6CAD|nr:DUF6387 family protein [Acinetobacter baylyi]